MTELDRMIALFDSLGVEYGVNADNEYQGQKATYVSPGQTHFVFVDGRYVGLEWDDMGYWDPRRETP